VSYSCSFIDPRAGMIGVDTDGREIDYARCASCDLLSELRKCGIAVLIGRDRNEDQIGAGDTLIERRIGICSIEQEHIERFIRERNTALFCAHGAADPGKSGGMHADEMKRTITEAENQETFGQGRESLSGHHHRTTC